MIQNFNIKPPISLFFSIVLLSNIIMGNAYAAIEVNQFDSPQQQVRYQHLIAELRCLVCQNQNLADSNADLAKDLRNKTLGMIKAGNSDKEILNYMQERYGDFVLYRPPFNAKNAILWAGPFVLLAITLLLLFINIRKRRSTIPSDQASDKPVDSSKTSLSDDALEQARTLLNSKPDNKNDD